SDTVEEEDHLTSDEEPIITGRDRAKRRLEGSKPARNPSIVPKTPRPTRVLRSAIALQDKKAGLIDTQSERVFDEEVPEPAVKEEVDEEECTICRTIPDAKRRDWTQCDWCKTWQHDNCISVGKPQPGAPYTCEICKERRTGPEDALRRRTRRSASILR
ncbi:JmjC domain-containing histone demethylation protein 1, partial [Elasticomyces elasticus]